jgi:hypothetical protein
MPSDSILSTLSPLLVSCTQSASPPLTFPRHPTYLVTWLGSLSNLVPVHDSGWKLGTGIFQVGNWDPGSRVARPPAQSCAEFHRFPHCRLPTTTDPYPSCQLPNAHCGVQCLSHPTCRAVGSCVRILRTYTHTYLVVAYLKARKETLSSNKTSVLHGVTLSPHGCGNTHLKLDT